MALLQRIIYLIIKYQRKIQKILPSVISYLKCRMIWAIDGRVQYLH